MTAQTEIKTGLAKLREPFPANQISKLPKESGKQRDERQADRNKAINCQLCGGWHHKNAVHLDYVGHAALTDRLLDVDPLWNWEPVAFGPDGSPAMDRNGGMWIKLTVCGHTRFGYGSADGKQGGDAVKEVIGDALRNAAMRFGAALDLWHKGDLHADEEPAPKQEPRAEPRQEQGPTPAQIKGAMQRLDEAENPDDLKAAWSELAKTPGLQTVPAVIQTKDKRKAEFDRPAPPPGDDLTDDANFLAGAA